jgi:hypothetical protein
MESDLLRPWLVAVVELAHDGGLWFRLPPLSSRSGSPRSVRTTRSLNKKPALLSPLEWWGSRGEDPVVGVRFVARGDGDQGRLCEGPPHEFETDREAMRGEPSRYNDGGKATERG